MQQLQIDKLIYRVHHGTPIVLLNEKAVRIGIFQTKVPKLLEDMVQATLFVAVSVLAKLVLLCCIVFSGGDSLAQGAAFARFIDATPCLRRQRGRIAARNSCRGSWVNTSNASVRQSLPFVGGRGASIQLEVFNVLNLLDRSWGLLQVPNPWILQYAGQTAGSAPQHKFVFDTTRIRSAQNAESGYQLQLSLRYAF